MLTVRFFSLIREAVDCEEMSVPWSEDTATVDKLRTHLANQGGEIWREALFQPNVVCARNQRVVDTAQALADGDEVAFFPPMTGG